MKKIIGILVCMLLIITAIPAVGQIKEISINKDKEPTVDPGSDDIWMKTYGGKKIDAGSAVLQVSDGYVVVGVTESYGGGKGDLWFIKTDKIGELIWRCIYGTDGDDFGVDVKQTNDGGFILTGYTERPDNKKDIWLIKTDNKGSSEWDVTFGNGNFDTGNEVIQTSDGGYVIVCDGDQTGGPRGDIWLIKTDSNGVEIWNKIFGGIGHNHGSSVQETSDGGFIICGSSYVNQETNGYDLWLIKTDNDGNEEWNKKYHNDGGDHGFTVRQTSDGGFIVVGITSSGAGNDKVWLIKTDENGDIIWDNTFGNSVQDRAYSVLETSDGGYILAGDTLRLSSSDAMVIKTDSNGNEEWTKNFGGLGNDILVSIEPTDDGGYILTGYETSGLRPDLWLVKTDSQGNVPVVYGRNIYGLRLFRLFPNLFKILGYFLR